MNDNLKRVRAELKAVGVGAVGLLTPEASELAKMLSPDEHIGGVVYGRYTSGLGWLVATNLRVIFIDRKPLFDSTDVLTYDVVSGIKSTKAGLFTSVTLHTRIRDYTIRYVSPQCAKIFVQYIEQRRLESESEGLSKPQKKKQQSTLPVFQDNNPEAQAFLRSHNLGVISTVDRTGNVHGAVVYYLIDQNSLIYILTKSDTSKSHNIHVNGQVAFTVHEPGTMKTAQVQGMAEIETDQKIIGEVFLKILSPKPYSSGKKLPPVIKLHKGDFTVIKISPTVMSFHDYDKAK